MLRVPRNYYHAMCRQPPSIFSTFQNHRAVAGSAFDYTYVVFGEGPAWSVGWSMVLETVLSSAAVARGLSGYAATLAGADARALLISIPALGLELDPLAAGLVLALSGLLIWSVKQGMLFNRGG